MLDLGIIFQPLYPVVTWTLLRANRFCSYFYFSLSQFEFGFAYNWKKPDEENTYFSLGNETTLARDNMEPCGIFSYSLSHFPNF